MACGFGKGLVGAYGCRVRVKAEMMPDGQEQGYRLCSCCCPMVAGMNSGPVRLSVRFPDSLWIRGVIRLRKRWQADREEIPFVMAGNHGAAGWGSIGWCWPTGTG